MPGIAPRNSCKVSHFILTRTAGNGHNHYHLHFADEETEAQRGQRRITRQTGGREQGILTQAPSFTAIPSC